MLPGQWLGKLNTVRAVIDTRSVTVEIPAGGQRVSDLVRLKKRLKEAIPGLCVSHLSIWDSGKQTTGSVSLLVDDTTSEPEQVLSDQMLLRTCIRIVDEELVR